MKEKPDPAEALMAALENVTALVDAVAGYKAKAVDAGFSESAAEMMAVAFHGALMEQMAANEWAKVGGRRGSR